jgi:PKD repeat protein
MAHGGHWFKAARGPTGDRYLFISVPWGRVHKGAAGLKNRPQARNEPFVGESPMQHQPQARGRRGAPLAPAALALSLLAAAAPASAGWVATGSKAMQPRPGLASSPVPAGQQLHVTVSLNLQNQAELKTLLNNLYRPGSPQYGAFLSSEQFESRYSPTAQQVQAVADYLRQSGFTDISIAPNRLYVSAYGTASQAQQAFNTQLVQFQAGGKTRFVAVRAPMVPDSLGGTVSAVLGLDNVTELHRNITHIRASDELPAQRTTPSAAGTPALVSTYSPAAYRNAYDAAGTPDGYNTTVAVFTTGDDLSQVVRDLRTSEHDNNLPYVPVQIVQTEAVPNPQDHSGDDEWDLDSQDSTGMAGNVKQLIFYNAGGNSITDLLYPFSQFAHDNLAQVMNVSVGTCESLTFATGALAPLDAAMMQAMSQGQTVSVASGDAGAACGLVTNIVTPDAPGIPSSVEYPTSSAYALSVGGTSLITDSAYNYVTETSWLPGGGGISLFEGAPSWQSPQVPSAIVGYPISGVVGGALGTSGTLRGVPDMAMNAGLNGPDGIPGFSGGDIVVNGQHGGVVGTSMSSPLAVGAWARMQTAHCNKLGFAPPALYALGAPAAAATGFHDTLVGTNGEYIATPGWDYTTGLGSFDISLVDRALPAAASGCVSTPAPAPTAALAASQNLGPAPLSVGFSGAASRPGTGAGAVDFYALDFGDGTVETQTKPVFPAHSYTVPGIYAASLSVRDNKGGFSKVATQLVNAFGAGPGCAAGGQVMLTSPPGAADAEQGKDLGKGTDDLLSTAISEPAGMDGELVFTMKVNNLSQVLPGFRWVTYFNIPGNSNQYYVAMVSSDGPSPAFNYGTFSRTASFSSYTVLGSLNSASTFSADGTITLVLDKAALGLHSGDLLSNIVSSTRTSAPDDPSGNVPGGEGLTQDSAGAALPYRIVGNSWCRANPAPVAKLSVKPSAGSLAATLSAVGSSDADSKDSIAYYRFDFGDGSPVSWGTSPTVLHSYKAAGTYKVGLEVANERGAASSPVQASVTLSTLPAVPTGLTAKAGPGQVTLSWSVATNATSYSVFQGTAAGKESATAVRSGLTATSVTLTGLSNGTGYYFVVKAVNAHGTSAASNEVSAVPQAPPAAPAGLTATAGTGQVSLHWTPSAGATGYAVYQGTSSHGESVGAVVTVVGNTSGVSVSGLSKGTKYYFIVKATNKIGASAASNEASATPN